MGLFNFFASYSQRELKKIEPTVKKIEALEEEYHQLSDEELQAKTAWFKERYAKGESLDSLLPEAFATVREAADRVLGVRPFRCQIIGGIILHQGRISEMRTGEGKTLVAVLPAYLNALSGKGVHIVTVNDYLARRDSEWMGKIHAFLGLEVGLIVHGRTGEERRKAYAADITYGTNNEFGFDYLRDNMVIYQEQKVQRGHAYAIVDEVDSILIDEARTPLIISGQGDTSDDMYQKANDFVRRLTCMKIKEMDSKESYDNVDADYIAEEKNKTATLTARGIEKAEKIFGVENLADLENAQLQHYINQALKAHGTMQRDVDYVVKDGEVIIVDEFTGRMMFGRRYSNGLHQAIEAKEGVKVENESKTLATITFQNYFRIYEKLAGMTGTAATEEDEFRQIYNLDVVEIPTNKPNIRKDHNDRVYKSEKAKFEAVLRQVKECYEKGQPVLIGTVTIEKSELLSGVLKRNGIPHNVLNAKYHEKEASIIAQAGRKGAVTIATNMAGRGTDIILGGNAEFLAKHQLEKEGMEHGLLVQASALTETTDAEVLAARTRYRELYDKFREQVTQEAEDVRAAGGLFILGTERHESRRIDNQLRGRAGRQGDPGETCFCLSLEDELLRLFGGERLSNLSLMASLPDDEPINAGILSKTIENAQKKVEGINFARRKKVLEYDDVINQQRILIYKERDRVLQGEDLREYLLKMLSDTVDTQVDHYCAGEENTWDRNGLQQQFANVFYAKDEAIFGDKLLSKEEMKAKLKEAGQAAYLRSETENTPKMMREIERNFLLRTVDRFWMDHIDAMDDLRQGISLRAYSNRDPLIEYKYESFEMFEDMIQQIKETTVRTVILARVVRPETIQRQQVARPQIENLSAGGEKNLPITKDRKVGRNDPCPCGSGKKYKKCCGKDE